MTKQERLNSIKAALERGASYTEAGKPLGMTRAAVSGLVGRNRSFFVGLVAQAPTKPQKRTDVFIIDDPHYPDVKPELIAKHHDAVRSLLGPLTLMELGPKDCRWPEGDKYCGRRVKRGAYCETHASRCYTKAYSGKARTDDNEPYRLPGAVR